MDKFYNIFGTTVAIAGVAIIGFLTLGSPVKADEIDNFQKEAIAPVVQLERNCSGTVVNTSSKEITYILTANHCLEEGLKVSGHVNIDVYEENSSKLIETKTYVYDVLTRSIPHDLAVLKVRAKNLNLDGVTIAQEDPKLGDEVWAVGYPMGLGRLITQGVFSGFDNFDDKTGMRSEMGNGMEAYRSSPPVIGGNSGGAMFIKRNGHYEQAGVTWAGFPQYFVYSLFHPQAQINDVLKDAMRIDASTETPTIATGNKKKD